MCTLQELYLSNNNLTGEFSRFIQNSSWRNGHIFEVMELSHDQLTHMVKKVGISPCRFLSLKHIFSERVHYFLKFTWNETINEVNREVKAMKIGG